MQKTEKTPLWVFLALSSIETRKGALLLIWSSIIFTLYCVPWVQFFEGQAHICLLCPIIARLGWFF
jgi:hypothetical protein